MLPAAGAVVGATTGAAVGATGTVVGATGAVVGATCAAVAGTGAAVGHKNPHVRSTVTVGRHDATDPTVAKHSSPIWKSGCAAVHGRDTATGHAGTTTLMEHGKRRVTHGVAAGVAVGVADGAAVGAVVATAVGAVVATAVGVAVGAAVGAAVAVAVGATVWATAGAAATATSSTAAAAVVIDSFLATMAMVGGSVWRDGSTTTRNGGAAAGRTVGQRQAAVANGQKGGLSLVCAGKGESVEDVGVVVAGRCGRGCCRWERAIAFCAGEAAGYILPAAV